MGSTQATEPSERVKKQLKSDNYSVAWEAPDAYDPGATLEIGYGSGHGFNLGWVRFLPGKDGVDVLSIQFGEGRHPYESKWPPDRAPVAVKKARLKTDAYAELLRDLAVVEAATLKAAKLGNSFTTSSNDFWVYARLTADKKALFDQEWAGYWGSISEVKFAKPQASAALAREAIKGLDFKDHSLTADERAWASEKFVRDWKNFKDLEAHWWVRERYIVTIGVVGDAAALPVLRDILGGDPKKRDVYHAINAITRITKKDVREKPVEEMDVEKTRRKVLEMLRDAK
ncbi:hypothetical protein FRUB_01971 [Fimbriiglobus ruber]|uniref:Uncharacterized protein n=1 Tax=Fimbriiglobus ruber TaxID=1908690 RepID=A0A225DVS6_9BACT|nr:hypothetical protein FRUB_01971 [Fimbriiglobus ruber]